MRNSPRARAGLSKFAASVCPGSPPAPIREWASSINKIAVPSRELSSVKSDFKRFSNSPLTLAPASRAPILSARILTFFSASGTRPDATCRAKPSTILLFPTPGSPVSIGLFCLRRSKISISCLISFSLPVTGSSFPVSASKEKFSVYLLIYSCGALSVAR